MMQAIQQSIRVLLYGVFLLIALLSVGSPFLWRYPLELLTNFRVYYLVIAAVMAIALMIAQVNRFHVRWLLLLFLGLTIVNSLWVVPWYLPQGHPTSDNRIRVLTFNINTANEQWDAIASAVRMVKPDIAVIIETSAEATTELTKRLIEVFPSVYRTSGGGLTIFSQFGLVSPQSKTFDHGTVLLTSLQINQNRVTLMAAHPRVPIKPSLFRRRNALLAEITTYLQQQPPAPLILLGDFNLTPWSPYYNRLVRKTGLHNTRLGFGIEPSWIEAATHVHYPRWITALTKIPIDHIFVSQNFQVLNCKTLRAANSDHRLLWSDLVLH